MDIINTLQGNRTKLSKSSIQTYDSVLRNLYKKVFPDDDQIDMKKFNESDKFLNLLKDVPINKRKSYLTALVVLTNHDDYRKEMMEVGNKFNEQSMMQKKSENQEQNWITQEQLKQTYQRYKVQANALFKLDKLNVKQLQTIQNYIILCLMSGAYIPIRRLLDWAEMELMKPSEDKGNYMITKPIWKFVFNVYKTSKFLGKQEVEIPQKLKLILTRWIKILKAIYPNNKYLLVDSTGAKLTSVKLNQRFNKIFDGKAISINNIRHSHITDKYKDLPSLKEMIADAEAMGHSLLQDLQYIKK